MADKKLQARCPLCPAVFELPLPDKEGGVQPVLAALQVSILEHLKTAHDYVPEEAPDAGTSE